MEGWTYLEPPGLILCDVFNTSVDYELGMGCPNHCKQLPSKTFHDVAKRTSLSSQQMEPRGTGGSRSAVSAPVFLLHASLTHLLWREKADGRIF